MHPPTPPARREAALRYQAEQLIRDAAAWGYSVVIFPGGPLNVIPNAHAQETGTRNPDELPQQSR